MIWWSVGLRADSCRSRGKTAFTGRGFADSESELIKETLGDHIFNHYLNIKGAEWDEYRTYVTDWEVQKYLKVL